MKKGDNIIGVRDNSVHIVECVDVYDTVTLVFTEEKKYIPTDFIRDMTLIEQIEMALNDNPEILNGYIERNIISNIEADFDKLQADLDKLGDKFWKK